jgi:hypothetical protein
MRSTHCNLTLSSPNGVEMIYLGSWLLTALGRQKTDQKWDGNQHYFLFGMTQRKKMSVSLFVGSTVKFT